MSGVGGRQGASPPLYELRGIAIFRKKQSSPQFEPGPALEVFPGKRGPFPCCLCFFEGQVLICLETIKMWKRHNTNNGELEWTECIYPSPRYLFQSQRYRETLWISPPAIQSSPWRMRRPSCRAVINLAQVSRWCKSPGTRRIQMAQRSRL